MIFITPIIQIFYHSTDHALKRQVENQLATKRTRSGAVISLGYDGYSTLGGKYWCEE